MMRKFRRLAILGVLALVLTSMVTALAAANTVPPSRLEDERISVSAENLKPPECSGIYVANIIVAGGFITFGTTGNDLILGSDGIDFILARNGDDCIVGGDGDDFINGGGGDDVCIGGPGADTLNGCETEY